MLDLDDTIAAVASAPGAAARGIVRVSGPQALEILRDLFVAESGSLGPAERVPRMISGTFRGDVEIPCDLFLWPTERSYTRQPTLEIHTFGSLPLLDCVLAEVCARGARLAEPGEFTLRAFVAGRIDLTQAEAVLGVIDARGQSALDAALAQLAGGLSRPLAKLREQLVQALAELEAGLDFVEEDIEFISRDQLHRQLTEAQHSVAEIASQMSERGASNELPRVVLCGPPNAGKSSLFNALASRWGTQAVTAAIVTSVPGTTRDYLTAILDLNGVVCTLVDTAGIDSFAKGQTIASAAQGMTGIQQRQADFRVRCTSVGDATELPALEGLEIHVFTKSDLNSKSAPGPACSSVTGEGLPELVAAIRQALSESATGGGVSSTTLRCSESIRLAEASLAAAVRLVETGVGDELIAAEVRHALHELGRVVGAVYTDDLLDRIFSQFCIGK